MCMNGQLFITGHAACELLGISRQLLSYHIKRLREQGYLRQECPFSPRRPRHINGRCKKVKSYSLSSVFLIASRVDMPEARVFQDVI